MVPFLRKGVRHIEANLLKHHLALQSLPRVEKHLAEIFAFIMYWSSIIIMIPLQVP